MKINIRATIIILFLWVSDLNGQTVIQGGANLVIEDKSFFACHLNPFHRFGMKNLDEMIWETGAYDFTMVLDGIKVDIICTTVGKPEITLAFYKDGNSLDVVEFVILSQINNEYSVTPKQIINDGFSCNRNGNYLINVNKQGFQLYYCKTEQYVKDNLILSAKLPETKETLISPSFIIGLKKIHPELNYAYLDSLKTHDYSGNWDFDGDGLLDSLSFVGDDAVHTNYHLKIVLSHDHIARNFEYLLSDFPFLADNSTLSISDTMVAENGFFWVGDFNSDGKMDIYLYIRTRFGGEIPEELKAMGINTQNVCIYYLENELVIKACK